jgi:hypothetical protein
LVVLVSLTIKQMGAREVAKLREVEQEFVVLEPVGSFGVSAGNGTDG